MTSPHPHLIESLAAWPSKRCAGRPVRGWAADPTLSRFPTAGGAAVAATGDPVVFIALAGQSGPEATTAALAAVAAHLRPVVRRWARCGMADADLADAEADLVAEALGLIRGTTTGSAAAVAQKSWHRVAGRRRTARARSARTALLDTDCVSPFGDSDPLRSSLLVITDALAAGLVTMAAASALWATVCGWPAVDAAAVAGCSSSAWRDRRDRGLKALRGGLDRDGGR